MTKTNRKLTAVASAWPALRSLAENTSVGTSHPSGPSEEAKAATKQHIRKSGARGGAPREEPRGGGGGLAPSQEETEQPRERELAGEHQAAADQQQRAAPDPVDERERDEREAEEGQAHDDGREQARGNSSPPILPSSPADSELKKGAAKKRIALMPQTWLRAAMPTPTNVAGGRGARRGPRARRDLPSS